MPYNKNKDKVTRSSPSAKKNMKQQSDFARLEARVDPQAKALWQEAAKLKGVSLTDFVVATMTESAIETIKAHRAIKLSREETETFIEAILNPGEPNPAILAAWQEHKRILES
jgi:uncharacterized protein (DUF1778 family)